MVSNPTPRQQIVSDFRANMGQGMTLAQAADHATHEANELASELRSCDLPWQAVNAANAWWNTEADWAAHV